MTINQGAGIEKDTKADEAFLASASFNSEQNSRLISMQ
jgi:hypothetical protein